MQVGSLVEFINDDWIYHDRIYPIKGIIYTVRCITDNGIGLLLEEIINPIMILRNILGQQIYDEPGFKRSRFRELQPPMDISIESLLEEPINV